MTLRDSLRSAALLLAWVAVFVATTMITGLNGRALTVAGPALVSIMIAGIPAAAVFEMLANACGGTAEGVPLPRHTLLRLRRPPRDTIAGRRLREVSRLCAGLPFAIAAGMFLGVLMHL